MSLPALLIQEEKMRRARAAAKGRLAPPAPDAPLDLSQSGALSEPIAPYEPPAPIEPDLRPLPATGAREFTSPGGMRSFATPQPAGRTGAEQNRDFETDREIYKKSGFGGPGYESPAVMGTIEPAKTVAQKSPKALKALGDYYEPYLGLGGLANIVNPNATWGDIGSSLGSIAKPVTGPIENILSGFGLEWKAPSLMNDLIEPGVKTALANLTDPNTSAAEKANAKKVLLLSGAATMTQAPSRAPGVLGKMLNPLGDVLAPALAKPLSRIPGAQAANEFAAAAGSRINQELPGAIVDAALGTAPAGATPAIPFRGSRAGSVGFGGVRQRMTKDESRLQKQGTAIIQAAEGGRNSPTSIGAKGLANLKGELLAEANPAGGRVTAGGDIVNPAVGRGAVLEDLAGAEEVPLTPFARPSTPEEIASLPVPAALARLREMHVPDEHLDASLDLAARADYDSKTRLDLFRAAARPLDPADPVSVTGHSLAGTLPRPRPTTTPDLIAREPDPALQSGPDAGQGVAVPEPSPVQAPAPAGGELGGGAGAPSPAAATATPPAGPNALPDLLNPAIERPPPRPVPEPLVQGAMPPQPVPVGRYVPETTGYEVAAPEMQSVGGGVSQTDPEAYGAFPGIIGKLAPKARRARPPVEPPPAAEQQINPMGPARPPWLKRTPETAPPLRGADPDAPFGPDMPPWIGRNAAKPPRPPSPPDPVAAAAGPPPRDSRLRQLWNNVRGTARRIFVDRSMLDNFADRAGGGEAKNIIAERARRMEMGLPGYVGPSKLAALNAVKGVFEEGADAERVARSLVNLEGGPDQFLYGAVDANIDRYLRAMGGDAIPLKYKSVEDLAEARRLHEVAGPGKRAEKLGVVIQTPNGPVRFQAAAKGDRSVYRFFKDARDWMHDGNDYFKEFVAKYSERFGMEPQQLKDYFKTVMDNLETPTALEFSRQFDAIPNVFRSKDGSLHRIHEWDSLPNALNKQGAFASRIDSQHRRLSFIEQFGQRVDGKTFGDDPLFQVYRDNGGNAAEATRLIKALHADPDAGAILPTAKTEPGHWLRNSAEPLAQLVRSTTKHFIPNMQTALTGVKSPLQILEDAPQTAEYAPIRKALGEMLKNPKGSKDDAIRAGALNEEILVGLSNRMGEAAEAMKDLGMEEKVAGALNTMPWTHNVNWQADFNDVAGFLTGRHRFDEMLKRAQAGGLNPWEISQLRREQLPKGLIEKIKTGFKDATPEEIAAARDAYGARMAQTTQLRGLPSVLRGQSENSAAMKTFFTYQQYIAGTTKRLQDWGKNVHEILADPNLTAGEKFAGVRKGAAAMTRRLVGKAASGELIRQVDNFTKDEGRDKPDFNFRDPMAYLSRFAGNLIYASMFGRLSTLNHVIAAEINRHTGEDLTQKAGKFGEYSSAPVQFYRTGAQELVGDVWKELREGEFKGAAKEAAQGAFRMTAGQNPAITGALRNPLSQAAGNKLGDYSGLLEGAKLLPPAGAGGGLPPWEEDEGSLPWERDDERHPWDEPERKEKMPWDE